MNRQRHGTSLLAILQDYAPNGPAQQKCTELLWSLQKTWGANYDKINEHLAGALIDGLRHGNWPWLMDQMSLASALERDNGTPAVVESPLASTPYTGDGLPG